MADKTANNAIVDALSDLSKFKLEQFRSSLIHPREGGPKVYRNAVEDKSIIQIADTLVQQFLEDGAVKLTVNILDDIGCPKVARELEKWPGTLKKKKI